MAGLGAQGKRKGQARAADLTVLPPEPPKYRQPPPDECYDGDDTRWDEGDERFIVRMRHQAATDAMVEFAVIHRTRVGAQFRTVAVADSCHDDEVHLHLHGRRADDRIGEPERLVEVTERAHLDVGYDLAYTAVVGQWQENKRRWRDA